jgi:hypothetical protein
MTTHEKIKAAQAAAKLALFLATRATALLGATK